MNRNQMITTCLLGLFLTLPACKKNDNKSPETPNGDLSVFIGTWNASCVVDTSSGYYQQQSLHISASAFSVVGTAYSDSSCSSSVGTLTEAGTYALEGQSSVLSGAYNIDVTFTGQSTMYTLLLLQNNTIYLSDSAGSSAQGRPSSVDMNMAYVKASSQP